MWNANQKVREHDDDINGRNAWDLGRSLERFVRPARTPSMTWTQERLPHDGKGSI
jgi:hypothetical protein